MINLVGCTKDNFTRLLKLMDYKQEKSKIGEEDQFTYWPIKSYKKTKKDNIKLEKDSPFKILSEVRFK